MSFGTDPRSGERGFTLIEIIVVIAILAILAGAAVPTVDLMQSRERTRATVDGMGALEEALDGYFADRMRYPDALSDLEAGGYLNSRFSTGDVFLDGWGNPLLYQTDGRTASLESWGPDQTNSADDYALDLDGTRFLIERTRDDLRTIHIALRNYESQRISNGLPALPPTWYDVTPGAPTALGTLIDEAYLPNLLRYGVDAWGTVYDYGGSPADFVTSANLP